MQSNFVVIDDLQKEPWETWEPEHGAEKKETVNKLGQCGRGKMAAWKLESQTEIVDHQFASYEKFLARWSIMINSPVQTSQ